MVFRLALPSSNHCDFRFTSGNFWQQSSAVGHAADLQRQAEVKSHHGAGKLLKHQISLPYFLHWMDHTLMLVSGYKLLQRFLEVQSFLFEQSASTICVKMIPCGLVYPAASLLKKCNSIR